jgi:hypothetical protein
VYQKDFHVPLYSSLVVGEWDTLTQVGGGNTELFGLHKTKNGVICVGYQSADDQGNPNGNNIPVINVPAWGSTTPSNQTAILVYYEATNLQNDNDEINSNPNTVLGSPMTPQLKVFPNPATTLLNIDFNLSQYGSNWKYEIYSTSMTIVDRGPLLSNRIDISSLPAGCYHIKLVNDTRFFMRTFIIAR